MLIPLLYRSELTTRELRVQQRLKISDTLRLQGVKSPEKPYLFIAGFSKEAFDTLPISLISGRLPENSGEILVPTHVAAKGGVRFTIGDTLTLAVGSRMDGDKLLGQHDPYQSGGESGEGKEVLMPTAEGTYTVVGIYERPTFEEHSAPGYTLITKADPAGPGGQLQRICHADKSTAGPRLRKQHSRKL